MPHSTNNGISTETRHYIDLSDLDSDAYTSYMIASARLYHMPFGAANDDWTYSQLKGLLVFGRDRSNADSSNGAKDDQNLAHDSRCWFRLVDATTGRTVWMFIVTPGLDYCQDKPFFHTFPGKSRMFGFCFDDDAAAAEFYRSIRDKVSIKSKSRAKNTKKRKPSQSRKAPISTSMISAPAFGSFVHTAHVGINQEGNMEASGTLDPSWSAIIQDLQGYGVSQRVVEENVEFIQGFLAGAKAARKDASSNNTQPSNTQTRRSLSF